MKLIHNSGAGHPKALPKIYLAGPDVFRPDYPELKARYKILCAAAGLQPLCPADDDADAGVDMGIDDRPLSIRIQRANLALIDQADFVMANLQNFRGHEPDSGTVFECGYAIGKGIPVFCYNMPGESLVDQVPQGLLPGHDVDGNLIENFGLSRNLMIVHSCQWVPGDAANCITAVAESLAGRPANRRSRINASIRASLVTPSTNDYIRVVQARTGGGVTL